MKTKISQIVAAAFFVVFLIAGNVNAKGTELSALSHEVEESELEIEDWMLCENFGQIVNCQLETVLEEAIEVENWMTDESAWETEMKLELETETEEELALESWMTEQKNWY